MRAASASVSSVMKFCCTQPAWFCSTDSFFIVSLTVARNWVASAAVGAAVWFVPHATPIATSATAAAATDSVLIVIDAPVEYRLRRDCNCGGTLLERAVLAYRAGRRYDAAAFQDAACPREGLSPPEVRHVKSFDLLSSSSCGRERAERRSPCPIRRLYGFLNIPRSNSCASRRRTCCAPGAPATPSPSIASERRSRAPRLPDSPTPS